MRIEYAPRAIADRVDIIGYYREAAGLSVADAFDRRLQESIEHLRVRPEIGPRVDGRPGVRALLLRRSP